MITGSCLCGATRFRLNGSLSGARYCHCANCRKFAGVSPAAWAMAKSADLAVHCASAGKFNSGRGVRNFCRECGCPVWFESLDFPEIVGIPLGVIDEGEVPMPGMHLWVGSMPAWCQITKGT